MASGRGISWRSFLNKASPVLGVGGWSEPMRPYFIVEDCPRVSVDLELACRSLFDSGSPILSADECFAPERPPLQGDVDVSMELLAFLNLRGVSPWGSKISMEFLSRDGT